MSATPDGALIINAAPTGNELVEMWRGNMRVAYPISSLQSGYPASTVSGVTPSGALICKGSPNGEEVITTWVNGNSQVAYRLRTLSGNPPSLTGRYTTPDGVTIINTTPSGNELIEAWSGNTPVAFAESLVFSVAPLSIIGTPVTTAAAGLAYAGFLVSGVGGTAPYTYSVASGTLPGGITINATTGLVSGTPTLAATASNIVLRVTDAIGATADLAPFDIAVTGILDQLSVAPVVAWSTGRALKAGKTPITGTPAAITLVNDQIGTNNLTPVAFSAAASDAANGLTYLLMNASADNLSLASAITLVATAEIYAGLGVTKAASASTVLGRDGVAGPYIRQSTTQATIRNTAGTVGTVTGSWTLKGFHYFRYVVDGTNFTVYVDGEQWGTVAFANTALGIFDRVGKGQTSNFYGGGLSEVIIFDQNLSAPDVAILFPNGESAWRTPIYVAGDGVGNNASVGWSPQTAWANYDLINTASSPVVLRPGSSVQTKYGAVIRRSPLYVINASQAGTLAKPNIFGMYGDVADGPARLILSESYAGATWTLDTGTRYYTTSTIADFQLVFWLKAGYTPAAYRSTWRGQFDAVYSAFLSANPTWTQGAAGSWSAVTPPANPFTVPNAMMLPLTLAASLGAMGANSCFMDTGASRLYIDIGQDPNGQNFEVAHQGTLVTARGIQTSRNNVFFRMNASVEFAAEDNLVFSGSDGSIEGVSATQLLYSIGAIGDAHGFKGGTGNLLKYVSLLRSGNGRSLSGSNGDSSSAHGLSGGSIVDCEAFGCDKAGYDHEYGTSVTHTRCVSMGNNQNQQILDQTSSGSTGSWTFTDSIVVQTPVDAKPAIQAMASVARPLNIVRGLYIGAPGSPDNTGLYLKPASKMNVTLTTNPTFVGFTTAINNASTAGGTVTTAP